MSMCAALARGGSGGSSAHAEPVSLSGDDVLAARALPVGTELAPAAPAVWLLPEGP